VPEYIICNYLLENRVILRLRANLDADSFLRVLQSFVKPQLDSKILASPLIPNTPEKAESLSDGFGVVPSA
jgi:hypothetical protein